MKCENCKESVIGEDKLCSDCRAKEIQKVIERNMTKTNITIFIGHFLAKETSIAIINTLKKYTKIKTIKLRARGRHISRAVDVLEILKRDLDIKSAIQTDTQEVVNDMDKVMNISIIKIVLTKT